MTSGYVIGIDQGTSSTKALLLDGTARVVAQTERPIAVDHPRPGWAEQDPEAMVVNVVSCARDLLDKTGVRAGDVAGLGLDNHTETLVLWERESGRAVCPAIIWQCRRSSAEVEAIDDAGAGPLIRRRTGLDLDPTFTATKLAWVFRNRPDIASGLRAGRVLWGTVDCWLVWRLTGGAVYATDYSNAARTMLFDIGALAWDGELAALFDLTLFSLPELRPSTGPFGRCRPEYLGADTPIAAALGDQQAALFGQGCLAPGELKCTYGTGAFLWMNAGQVDSPVDATGCPRTLAWYLDGPTYAREGFVMYAGAALEWLVHRLGICADAAGVLQCAREAQRSDGVMLVPAFQGLASPWWNPRARAAVLGLSGDTGKGAICHSALEAICFQVRKALEAMEGGSVSPSGTMRVDGGLTRSGYLLQLQADILGLPVQAADMQHVTAFGTALMAGIGAGLWRAGEVPGAPGGKGARYEPQSRNASEWTERYLHWCRAVELCIEWSAR